MRLDVIAPPPEPSSVAIFVRTYSGAMILVVLAVTAVVFAIVRRRRTERRFLEAADRSSKRPDEL